MKRLLGGPARTTRWSLIVGLTAAWMVGAGSGAPARAQEGPGVRAGVSANPDQFFFGGHYVTRPIAGQLRFQPNVEAGFGSDTTLVAFNVEFGYWMRLNRDWHVYFGGGPAMNVISTSGHEGTDVEPGFNILAGLRHRRGLFFELKVGTIDSPDVKVAVGYTIR
jgi:hypothetical protein